MKRENGREDRGRQLLLDWNTSELAHEIAEGKGGSSRAFGFDCTAQHFAEMEIVRLRARSAVNQAVKAGTLRRPERCEACLGFAPLAAHHHDYALPLSVTWLCSSCHRRETREIAARARASLPNEIHRPGFRGTPSWALKAIKKGAARVAAGKGVNA